MVRSKWQGRGLRFSCKDWTFEVNKYIISLCFCNPVISLWALWENNALQLANWSVHYIGNKNRPYNNVPYNPSNLFARVWLVWTRHVTEYSPAKTGEYPRLFPNFQNFVRCKKDSKDNKHNSLHLGRKYARIFVLGHYLFLEAHSFPQAWLLENCSPLGTDNVRRQISEHIFAPNGGFCLYIHVLSKWTTKLMEGFFQSINNFINVSVDLAYIYVN